MTYVIAAPCVDNMDQACAQACPVDCISHVPGVDRKAYIDPEGCIECGACATACPQGAIFPHTQLPPEWVDFAEVDRGWWIDQDWAREAVNLLVA